MSTAASTHAHHAVAARLVPRPLQYELRIGVTGHRDVANSDQVEIAVRQLLRQIVDVLTGASEAPLGPHGTPRSRMDRLDRLLTRSLAIGTRIVCPVLDAVTNGFTTAVRAMTHVPERHRR